MPNRMSYDALGHEAGKEGHHEGSRDQRDGIATSFGARTRARAREDDERATLHGEGGRQEDLGR